MPQFDRRYIIVQLFDYFVQQKMWQQFESVWKYIGGNYNIRGKNIAENNAGLRMDIEYILKL